MNDKDILKEEIDPTGFRGYKNVHAPLRSLLFYNFLGGLAWGFGTVLGATIVVALVLMLLSRLDTIPVIGQFITNLIEEINRQSVQ